MTEYSDWDSDDQQGQEPASGPKALRDAYERQKQEAHSLKKQLDELNQKVRRQEVSELLGSKGIPKEAVDLFPKDIEVTADSVATWVEKYGPLFSSAQKAETKEEEPTTAQEETSQADKDQLAQIQQVTSGGQPGGTSKQDFENALANPNLHDELPFDAFKEMLRGQGVKV